MKKSLKKQLNKQATRKKVAKKANQAAINAYLVENYGSYSNYDDYEDLQYYHTLANEASLEHSMGGPDYLQTEWR